MDEVDELFEVFPPRKHNREGLEAESGAITIRGIGGWGDGKIVFFLPSV